MTEEEKKDGKRRIRRRSLTSLLGILGIFVVLTVSVIGYLHWQRVPVLEFTAVCRNFIPFSDRSYRYGNLEQVPGPYTEEFWGRIYTDMRNFAIVDSRSISVDGDRPRIGIDFYFDIGINADRLDGEVGTWRYHQSSRVVSAILQRRAAEGRFTPELQERFRVRDWWTDEIRPMYSDECGMMEELIQVGGVLSSEP